MKFNYDKFKKNDIVQRLAENYSLISSVLLLIQIQCLISIFLIKKSCLIFSLIIFILSVIFFIMLKEFSDEKQTKFAITKIKFGIVIFIMSLVNGGIASGISSVNDEFISNKLFSINYLLDIAIIIFSLSVFLSEKAKDITNTLNEINILSELVGNNSEEIEIGDAVLGNDIETGEPVILPNKDRFLHMLILGPTGCGKTSQTIIPMINRDMQNLEAGITVIEPKGDLAEKVWAMAEHYNRKVLYFNPILPDCPYFNPLYGNESDVVENMATTFKMLNPDAPQFFQDMSENLIRKSVKILKRVYGNDATILHLDKLVHNPGGDGLKIINQFSKLSGQTESIICENKDIYQWFKDDYYAGQSGERGCPKTYEHCSGVRSQIAKLVSNKYLRKVLNPPIGVGTNINFDEALEDGYVISIATAQGSLRDLGRFLGYFIILQLQSSVFRRKGNESTRRNNFLYIDEFQVYANPGFADMLTQGRSYRVASHLATQAKAQIGMGSGKEGKNFEELVSTNARNLVIYPGVSYADAEYYSKQFGEILKITEGKSYSKSKFNIFSRKNDMTVKETTAIKEEYVSRFSPTDIRFKEFGEVTYCIIKKNSIQAPGVSKIQYIPNDLNNKLDNMVAEFNKEQELKADSDFENNINQNKEVDLSNEYLENTLELNKENTVIRENVLNIPDPIYLNEDVNYFEEGDESAKTLNPPVLDNNSIVKPGCIEINDEEEYDDF